MNDTKRRDYTITNNDYASVYTLLQGDERRFIGNYPSLKNAIQFLVDIECSGWDKWVYVRNMNHIHWTDGNHIIHRDSVRLKTLIETRQHAMENGGYNDSDPDRMGLRLPRYEDEGRGT